MKIKEGLADEFERIFLELAAEVRENEPGNLTYQLCRSRDDALTYKAFELYRDDDALEAHFASGHVSRMREGFKALLVEDARLEYLDAVI